MSVHYITERLSDETLAARENVVFGKLYTCYPSAIRVMQVILSWHKERIHDRVLDVKAFQER